MKKPLAVAALLTLCAAALWAQSAVRPQDKKDDPKIVGKDTKAADEKALLEALCAYREAFNRGEADALAKQFTEQAELIDDTGEVINGREAIRQAFGDYFKRSPGARVELSPDWFRWLSNEVILEHGTAKVTAQDGSVTATNYTAAHVKKDGKWLIASVREIPAAGSGGAAQKEHLQALDWLVGEWVDADDSGTIKIKCAWNRNKTFLTRSFSVTTKSGVALDGKEVIGWDQSRGVLRSWVFDSTGAFGEGIWLHKGNRWYCKMAGVRPDGQKACALHVYTPQGPDSYSWRSVHRQIDGAVQPDLDEVIVRRVSSPDNQ